MIMLLLGCEEKNEYSVRKTYSNYYKLIKKYQKDYGMFEVKKQTEMIKGFKKVELSNGYYDNRYIVGLCFCDLIDVNHDGVKELLLVHSVKDYYDRINSEKNDEDYNNDLYTFEIWGCKKGKLYNLIKNELFIFMDGQDMVSFCPQLRIASSKNNTFLFPTGMFAEEPYTIYEIDGEAVKKRRIKGEEYQDIIKKESVYTFLWNEKNNSIDKTEKGDPRSICEKTIKYIKKQSEK